MRSIRVRTRSRPYSVLVHRTPWRLGRLPESLLGDGGRVVLLSDQRVASLYIEKATKELRRLGLEPVVSIVAAGEKSKSMKVLESVAREMLRAGANRKTPLITFGGGGVGDLGGLVANLYMRGVPLFHVPTTLLAQVDSSVGGKTAVNLPEGKNLLGTFWQPRRVWICPEYLKTLRPRQVREGLAEVLKYGFIQAPELLEMASEISVRDPTRGLSRMEDVLVRSVEVKASVVAKDEKESGLRQILNFGHSFGHTLEVHGRYRRFSHGEAVGLGMVMALGLGESLGITDPALRKDLKARLDTIGLPSALPSDIAIEELIPLLARDKKQSRAGISFVLISSLGKPVIKELEIQSVHSMMKSIK